MTDKIRFIEHTKFGGDIEHTFSVESSEDPIDGEEWAITDRFASAVDGEPVRKERGHWTTRGLALANLEYHFAQYAKSHNVDRIE